MTLSEIIESQHCRRGKAAGTTKRGAFWLACEPIRIRSYGGDGIGQNAADMENMLHLRHFRDGDVRATIRVWSWHQNGGDHSTYMDASSILTAQSVEDVIVALKAIRVEDDYEGYGAPAYSDHEEDKLTAALTALGMPVSAPAPDETTA